ncbi:MAG TPA: tRNA (adenosine(37)-N6)-threonylcarbamoyltransferase complex dimerization subunit type 1 TsaB, partial [Anaeromyxobacteraceae bacterium]|nr:tRNA (adenosine(37)-N6)-threonylcarbamoyltransferase complex dimerization subunit type 1 TsaB [Anaeromyxobacteraceae bacterium]
MLVAALDTATLTLSCALCEISPAGEVTLVAERTERAASRAGPQGATGGHGGRLPGALSDLLLAAGLKLPDVEGYAIGLGPGSFTGLRIGLATWKGLAYANRRPIAGASSLAALALAGAGGAPGGALLVPLLDAKKGEVYAGFYRAAGAGVAEAAPEAALAPAALVERARELAGEGPRRDRARHRDPRRPAGDRERRAGTGGRRRNRGRA